MSICSSSNVWERRLTNQNVYEEVKSKWNSENAWYHSVKNLLSSHFLYRNMRTKILKSVILPVSSACET
jgi:hypothetical protein